MQNQIMFNLKQSFVTGSFITSKVSLFVFGFLLTVCSLSVSQNLYAYFWPNFSIDVARYIGSAMFYGGIATCIGVAIATRSKWGRPKQIVSALSVVLIASMLVSPVAIALTPLPSDTGPGGSSAFKRSVPISDFEWFVAPFRDNSYYAINGSDWNIMTIVEPWQAVAPWTGLSSNLTALVDQCIDVTTSGVIFLKGCAYNYNLTIPGNVTVVESLNGLEREFVSSASTQGSPYTISTDTVNSGYYLAQDKAGRYLDEWTSTNQTDVAYTALVASTNGEVVLNNIPESNYNYSKILCLGDSITAGSGITTTYPANLQNLLNVPVTMGGVGGDRTTSMQTRWDTYKTQGYDTLVLLGGVNDITYGTSAIDIEANLQNMWEEALALNMNVYALTLTPFKGDTLITWDDAYQVKLEAINTWILATAPTLGVTPIDTYNVLNNATHPEYLASIYDGGDGIHPNQQGTNAITLAVYDAIKADMADSKVAEKLINSIPQNVVLTKIYNGTTQRFGNIANVASSNWQIVPDNQNSTTYYYAKEASQGIIYSAKLGLTETIEYAENMMTKGGDIELVLNNTHYLESSLNMNHAHVKLHATQSYSGYSSVKAGLNLNAPMITIFASGVEISNINLIGNYVNQNDTWDGIVTSEVILTVIDKVTFQNFKGNQITISGGYANTISRCSFLSNLGAAYPIYSGAINFTNTKGNLVKDNFAYSSNSGIIFKNSNNSRIIGNQFTNGPSVSVGIYMNLSDGNIFSDNIITGFQYQAILMYGSRNNTFATSNLHRNGQVGTDTINGIWLRQQGTVNCTWNKFIGMTVSKAEGIYSVGLGYIKYGYCEENIGQDYNMLVDCTFLDANIANIYTMAPNTKVSNCWNGTAWIGAAA